MWLSVLLACATPPPAALGDALAPCPDKPNCVSSQAPESDARHHIAPLSFDGDPEAAWARLEGVMKAMPRVALHEEGDDSRHYVFTTAVMRFRDDVHFLMDRESKTIHVRSASRVGHSDLGVNRKRVEKIRAALAAVP